MNRPQLQPRSFPTRFEANTAMPPRIPRKGGPRVAFRVQVAQENGSAIGSQLVLSLPSSTTIAALKHHVANRHPDITRSDADEGVVRTVALTVL